MSAPAKLLRHGRRRDVLRAMQAASEPVTPGDIAESTDIPERYVQDLFGELADDGTIEIVDDHEAAKLVTYRLADPDAVEEPPTTESNAPTPEIEQHTALVADAIADDEVRACPVCDSTQIRRRKSSIQTSTAKDDKEWICKQQGHTFDEAVVRKRRHPGPGGGRSTTRAAGGADD